MKLWNECSLNPGVLAIALLTKGRWLGTPGRSSSDNIEGSIYCMQWRNPYICSSLVCGLHSRGIWWPQPRSIKKQRQIQPRCCQLPWSLLSRVSQALIECLSIYDHPFLRTISASISTSNWFMAATSGSSHQAFPSSHCPAWSLYFQHQPYCLPERCFAQTE